MILGISSPLRHRSPREWAAKHKALGLEAVVFPVDHLAGEEAVMAYKAAADEAGLSIAEVGVCAISSPPNRPSAGAGPTTP